MELKLCPGCQAKKPRSEFYVQVRSKDHLSYYCKTCSSGRARTWQLKHPSQNKQSYEKRFNEDPSKIRKQKLSWQTKRHRELKMMAFRHYGGDPPKCNCSACQETRPEFLCIDHIGGGGSQHRSTFSGSIYWWLHKNNYPDGFRVLCHNCNMSTAFYGYCPHQTDQSIFGCIAGFSTGGSL